MTHGNFVFRYGGGRLGQHAYQHQHLESMSFNEMREQIANSMAVHSLENWWRILENTNPGNYGVDDVEFQIDTNDIWVSLQARTFTFRNGTLSFSARLLSSNDRDGVDMNFERLLSGSGTFEFQDGEIKVLGFSINEDIELFEEQPA